jgi:hypothetical protein
MNTYTILVSFAFAYTVLALVAIGKEKREARA